MAQINYRVGARSQIKTARAKWPNYSLKDPQTTTDNQCKLEAARAVGNRIKLLMLRGEYDVSWIGLTLTPQNHWSLVSLGMDLYGGIPGIAIFLAYLGKIANERNYTILAQAALTTIQHQVKQTPYDMTSIGAFDGWGGIIYTLVHLGTLWNQTELLAEAEELVELFQKLIKQDKLLDVIGGAAGFIGSLLSLYYCKPSDRILAAALQCGDHLIAHAKSMDLGIGWHTKIPATEPLTGFSHGAAGIAWALLELSALTGEERFRTVALEAIAYERSLFCPELGNWPDLRKFANTVLTNKNNRQNCMTAWCHGAPGIGLARLRCLPYLDDREIKAEIDTALKTTLKQGFGHNHSLCHGDLGNLELLLQASLTFNDSHLKAQVDRFTAIILESINKHGWLCGVPLGVETPGLMTGLAGIGYQLLRLAEPERVPSVLVLEPPKIDSTAP